MPQKKPETPTAQTQEDWRLMLSMEGEARGEAFVRERRRGKGAVRFARMVGVFLANGRC